jgi:hypothetical protein
MPFQLIAGIIVAIFAFIALPLGGAFMVRTRWRTFRRLINQISILPRYNGGFHHEQPWVGLIYGFVEGVQGRGGLWIRSQGRSIRISAKDAIVHVLEGRALNNRAKSLPQPPVRLAWQHVGALAEGAKILAYGSLVWQRGRLQLEAAKDQPGPWLIFYEGDDPSLLRRLISNGRQQNEFWNVFTPFGLMIGFAMVAALALSAFQEWPNRLWGVLLSTLALMPFCILLPPGIGSYYAYRYLWRRSRRIRVRRDLMDLQEGLDLARRQRLEKKASQLELLAVGLFTLGILVNSIMVFWLTAQLAAVN